MEGWRRRRSDLATDPEAVQQKEMFYMLPKIKPFVCDREIYPSILTVVLSE